MSGVNTKRVDFLVMTNMGLLAGLAGLVTTARLTAANPKAGVNFELDAIAAAFIGGAAVTGGVGTVIGAIIGGLVMGVLNNGMSLMSVSIDWQQAIKGLVLLARSPSTCGTRSAPPAAVVPVRRPSDAATTRRAGRGDRDLEATADHQAARPPDAASAQRRLAALSVLTSPCWPADPSTHRLSIGLAASAPTTSPETYPTGPACDLVPAPVVHGPRHASTASRSNLPPVHVARRPHLPPVTLREDGVRAAPGVRR